MTWTPWQSKRWNIARRGNANVSADRSRESSRFGSAPWSSRSLTIIRCPPWIAQNIGPQSAASPGGRFGSALCLSNNSTTPKWPFAAALRMGVKSFCGHENSVPPLHIASTGQPRSKICCTGAFHPQAAVTDRSKARLCLFADSIHKSSCKAFRRNAATW